MYYRRRFAGFRARGHFRGNGHVSRGHGRFSAGVGYARRTKWSGRSRVGGAVANSSSSLMSASRYAGLKFTNAMYMSGTFSLPSSGVQTQIVVDTNDQFLSWRNLLGSGIMAQISGMATNTYAPAGFPGVALDHLNAKFVIDTQMFGLYQGTPSQTIAGFINPSQQPNPEVWVAPNYWVDYASAQSGGVASNGLNAMTKWIRLNPQPDGSFHWNMTWQNKLPHKDRFTTYQSMQTNGSTSLGDDRNPYNARNAQLWAESVQAASEGSTAANQPWRPNLHAFMRSAGVDVRNVIRWPAFRVVTPYFFAIQGTTLVADGHINVDCQLSGSVRVEGTSFYTAS